MKRFLVATSTKNNDSKKPKNLLTACKEEAFDDPESASEKNEAISPTVSDGCDQINLWQNYLFNGQFYNTISNGGKKLVAKCVNCLKFIQGQINLTGNFLSHIKACLILFF